MSCDTEDHDALPAKQPAKVLSIGSFCPAWDAERKARNAQQQIDHDYAAEIAKLNIHSSDAGKYSPGGGDEEGSVA